MTDRYAAIGNPISHSKSPFIHQEFARQTGQEIVYEAILAPLDGFAATVKEFRTSGGMGANVTAPFKLEAYALATDRTERARLAGAANVLKFEEHEILADNVDGVGLVRDIQVNLGVALGGTHILLLGAGGAARGLLLPLLQQEPRLLTIANRTMVKAHALREEFACYGNIVARGCSELADETFDVVINATSASLRGEAPVVPQAALTRCALAYELAYGKGLTPFLRLARDTGAGRLVDGTGMLVEQAAESFFIWRGIRPKTEALIQRMSTSLG